MQACFRRNEFIVIFKNFSVILCQKDVVLNSSILVNFVTRSALQKCELNYNCWRQFVSAIHIQPGILNCPDCKTSTCEPVLTSIADSKFVVIEFS